MKNTQSIATAIFLAFGLTGTLQAASPPGPQWERMIQCETSYEEYNKFVMTVFPDEAAKKALKIKKIEQANPFLEEYELPEDIQAFGYSTRRIVFTSAGIMAVVDEKEPAKLAEKLKMEIAYNTGTKILATKVISETEPAPLDEMKMWTTVSQDLSTVDTHPSKTLVGCTYKTNLE